MTFPSITEGARLLVGLFVVLGILTSISCLWLTHWTVNRLLNRQRERPVPESVGALVDLPANSLSLKIDLSPEVIEALARIEKTTGDSLDEILAKAIALYRMSVEAHHEGKRIGVFDRDFELEREVVGFVHRAAS